MLTFKRNYFILTILLFITEVLIALYVHDKIVRPYIGDMLVVILIYCFVRTFFKWTVVPTAIGVLIFSYVVETLQYFKIVEVLGLQDSAFFRTVIGTSFVWMDLVMYTLGIVIVLIMERVRLHKK
ncbi:ribosomal maturation YjgA family protein [Flavobacterium sp.]|uniref:ribosomal maturation YjgA family protein n=1 Tax=Flavobacterium sp. TaxID=239 RepID=UPI004033CD09